MRKFLANILFFFLGLPLALSALFLVSVRPWALDRETYRRFVEDDRLYAALQAPEMASRAPAEIKLGPAAFDGPALTLAAQKNLPVPEIKATAMRAVDSALAALGTGRSARPELDLKPLKTALRARGPALARDYAAALAAEGGGTRGAAGAATPAQLGTAIGAAIDTIPDTARAPVEPTLSRRQLGGPFGVMSRGQGAEGLSQAILNRMTATTAAVSALLLAGLGALGGSGLVSRLSRGGRYLFIPSIIVLGIGAVLAIPGGLILQNVLPHEIQAMVSGSAGAQLRAYLISVLGPIAQSFLVTGLVGASIGGVLAQSRRFAEPKELE